MLLELSIRKMALIEECTLSFGPGLNVITGETGAGKSLLVGALELLLGQRPRPGLVRAGASQLSVEGRFSLGKDGARVLRWLGRHLPELELERESDEDEFELVLGRSVSDEGKSRAYVNHRPVTLRTLRELAARLVEIHGQNDHQRLLEPAEQLRLLDNFGGLDAPLAQYREARGAWLELAERQVHLRAEQAERRRPTRAAAHRPGPSRCRRRAESRARAHHPQSPLPRPPWPAARPFVDRPRV
jgi:DNA repair protein RecN (Recombination protein N)